MPYVKAAEFRRLQAADETCWRLLLALSLGLLEVELATRKFIAEGGLEDWSNRCVEAGLMREDEPSD